MKKCNVSKEKSLYLYRVRETIWLWKPIKDKQYILERLLWAITRFISVHHISIRQCSYSNICNIFSSQSLWLVTYIVPLYLRWITPLGTIPQFRYVPKYSILYQYVLFHHIHNHTLSFLLDIMEYRLRNFSYFMPTYYVWIYGVV